MATQPGRGRDQNGTLNILTNLDQNSPTGKEKRKDDFQSEKTTEQSYGCKMRVLFGYVK